ncbi:aromatic ring-hydroxylating dioxygenase subunit alpha [Ammonicoccus fulvus]|uniref:Aromatic ring-hydroxylating dioxygenase subunit alpha n=1 Tax=Ammonicoccus fulvus TaxID=3138240 RepID=A0ABZ3FMI5_9ACTN
MDVSDWVDARNGFIRGEIFTSEEVYQAELKNVFARSWVFLAHDSMLKKAGDFIQNYIGEDPVVVVRQADGSVKAWLNQCRHRGMRICRADRGNTRYFMCSFHGWVYDREGSLVQVPHEEEAYAPETFDKADYGPRQVPRLHNYKGFWFGNWDETAPDFEDYIGDFKYILDSHIDRHEGGLEVVGQHRWIIPANWKYNAEQPSNDSYHAETSHASALTVLERSRKKRREEKGEPDNRVSMATRAAAARGKQFSGGFGHGAGWHEMPEGAMRYQAELPATMEWEDSVRDKVEERLDPYRNANRSHANLFPNFMMLANGTMRVTHPRGPNEMEIWAWTFAPAEAPDEVKEEIRVNVLRTFSAAGMFEQDDAENWLEEQRIFRGYMARQDPLVYTMRIGDARRGLGGVPGIIAPSVYADEGARGMYHHWAELMSGDSWDDIARRNAERLAQVPHAEADNSQEI